MKKTDLAYVAGIMDGEGYVGIRIQRKTSKNGNKHYAKMEVRVGSTDQWLCQYLRMMFGGNLNLRKKVNKGNFSLWTWYLSGDNAADFLRLILPYLKLKRPQAEVAIEFQTNRSKHKYNRHHQIPEEEWVLQQAQAILVKEMKKQKI